ncbi:MAG: LysR family transcriptional regulator [Pseudomonadota bacterium]
MGQNRPLAWEELQFLQAVAATGSFKQAADVLDSNHATVKRKIVALEAWCGAALVKSTSTGSALTELGEALVEQLSEMAHTANQIEKLVRNRESKIGGEVTLEATDLIASNLIGRQLGAFLRESPSISLKIDSGLWQIPGEPIRPDLQLSFERPDEDRANSEVIARCHYAFYTSAAYLAHKKENGISCPTNLRDITQHTILYCQSQQHQTERWPTELLALSELITECIRLSVSTSSALIEAALDGAGIAALPTYVTEDYPELIPLPVGKLYSAPVYLCTDRAVRNSLRVGRVSKWLRGTVFDTKANPWLADTYRDPLDWWIARSTENADLLGQYIDKPFLDGRLRVIRN